MFLRVHGIDEQIERSREAMRELPGDATLRLRLGWFLLHAGRYEEAAFFLTESLDKWPEDNSLRTALGCSFLLVGDRERGTQVLEQVVEAGAELPLAYTFLALSRFARPADTNTPESLIREAVPILQQVEKALALSDGDPSKHVDARIFCAWLLTALPPVFACHERGHGLLVDALETLRKGPADRRGAGWHERALVSAAHFLLESLSRPATPLPAAAPWTPAATTPSIEELQTLICRLDPACALAATAYLVEKESTPQKRSQETP